MSNKVGKNWVVFCAVYPNENGIVPAYLHELEEDAEITVLHPNYNWENSEGNLVLQSLDKKLEDVPATGNIWTQIILRDEFAIGLSNIMIYDIDQSPNIDLLHMAYQDLVIIGVSETLRAPPLRYSGQFATVVRPDRLKACIKDWPL
jgi:hypothetical protein